jgi:hypothetical protein
MRFLLAALLGLRAFSAADTRPPVCEPPTVVVAEAKITLTGKLVRKVYLKFGPEGDFAPPVGVVVWELHSGDKVHRLDVPEALLAKARRLDGKVVIVVAGGERARNGFKVEKLDEAVADVPLPILPKIEKDLRGPGQPVMPALKEDDLFGRIFEGPDGFTLTTDDGKVLKVLIPSGKDGSLVKDARRLQTWRFGVQARGVVVGDTLILSAVWAAEPRTPR